MIEPGILDPCIEPVEAWRLKQLLDAGYPIPLAEKLAIRSDVDLHQALRLVGSGCTHETAGRILL